MTTGEKQMAEKAEHYQEKYGQLPETVAAASSLMLANADGQKTERRERD